VIALVLVLATKTADKPTTFLVLFFGELLSWAGVPALGAAAVGAAGALAHQGTVHLWAVLVIGTLGAEIGGMVGWWLGNRIARAGDLEADGRFAGRRRRALESGSRFAGCRARWGWSSGSSRAGTSWPRRCGRSARR
jgi:membrane protein DedA with SNARE-associated domain